MKVIRYLLKVLQAVQNTSGQTCYTRHRSTLGRNNSATQIWQNHFLLFLSLFAAFSDHPCCALAPSLYMYNGNQHCGRKTSYLSRHLPEAYRTPGYHKLCCTKIEQSRSQHTVSYQYTKNLQYMCFIGVWNIQLHGSLPGRQLLHLPVRDLMAELSPWSSRQGDFLKLCIVAIYHNYHDRLERTHHIPLIWIIYCTHNHTWPCSGLMLHNVK